MSTGALILCIVGTLVTAVGDYYIRRLTEHIRETEKEVIREQRKLVEESIRSINTNLSSSPAAQAYGAKLLRDMSSATVFASGDYGALVGEATATIQIVSPPLSDPRATPEQYEISRIRYQAEVERQQMRMAEYRTRIAQETLRTGMAIARFDPSRFMADTPIPPEEFLRVWKEGGVVNSPSPASEPKPEVKKCKLILKKEKLC